MKLTVGFLALALPLSTSLAAAQEDYPSEPVRIIVPFSPGGGTDILTRILSPHLQERLGQPIVVENKPGGGSTIGTTDVVNADPDGYTFLMVDTAITVNPSLYDDLPYDTMEALDPVSLVATAPVILVAHPSLGVDSVEELIALSKERPGELTFASGGNGSSTHLALELFQEVTGLDTVHVPYRGSGPAVTDLVGGHVDLMFTGISSARPHVDDGRLVALAVTGEERNEAVPDVPTFAELGLEEVAASSYWGLLAPEGTPPEIIDQVSGEVAEIMQIPEVVASVKELGYVPIGGSAEDYAANLEGEMQKWAGVVERAGIEVD